MDLNLRQLESLAVLVMMIWSVVASLVSVFVLGIMGVMRLVFPGGDPREGRFTVEIDPGKPAGKPGKIES